MIEYHVFVALHAAKASSINVFLHVQPFFYLHIVLVDRSLAAKSTGVVLSYSSKACLKSLAGFPSKINPEEQDAWVGHSEACALRSPADNVY